LGKIELVKKIAQKAKIDIKYNIPYSKKLVKAYSEGKLERINLL
jgi:MinD superfamily P-loop ATPase